MSIQVQLPDGSVREVLSGTTPLSIAESISPRLAQAAVVARIRPLKAAPVATTSAATGEAEMYAAEDTHAERLVDLATPLQEDVALELLTDKAPDALKVLRHSAAHVMATAVTELFPETKLGHGPATETGFFYDFWRPTPFTPEDLKLIEGRMAEVTARDEKFVREHEPREKGLEEFRTGNDFMKVHFVEKFTQPGDEISLYRNGKFVDFCRGPHVPSTGRVKAFKVMSLSGAYWLGDEKNPQLQRIYGTAFFSKKDLDDYLERIEDAKRRDHRRLGKELELFTVSEEVGAGLPLWLPKGATIRRLLEDYILGLERELGYEHVYTPDLAKVDLYKRSGHWAHYHEDMFPPMDLETEQMVLRPMNCPHHILDLRVEAAQLSRSAREDRRTRHHVPLRALRRAQRPQPRALHDAERRAHLLHARPDQGRVLQRDAARRAHLQRPRHHEVQLPPLPPRSRRTKRSMSTTTPCGSWASANCAKPSMLSASNIARATATPPSTAPSSISSSPTSWATRKPTPPSSSISTCPTSSASNTPPPTARSRGR